MTSDKIWDNVEDYLEHVKYNMMTPQEMVTEFHTTFGQPTGAKYEYISDLS